MNTRWSLGIENSDIHKAALRTTTPKSIHDNIQSCTFFGVSSSSYVIMCLGYWQAETQVPLKPGGTSQSTEEQWDPKLSSKTDSIGYADWKKYQSIRTALKGGWKGS